MNGKGTLRPYILVTLGHAERRKEITSKQIEQTIRKLFQCSSIVIAKEKHQDEGWHRHVAIRNYNASKNNATKKIREAFKDFEGRQCNVAFHKGFANLIGYVTKKDKEPHVWGEFTKEEILQIGEKARAKKKTNHKPVKEIIQKINECQQWEQVYEHIQIVERMLYGSHSNVKKVYQDLKGIRESKEGALQRIQRYLDDKEVEKRGIKEYRPEEIKEKYPLIDWIACNLIYQRPLKTKQLLLYGPPSTQKTLVFNQLKKAIRIYFVGVRMNDFAGADDHYDLWVFDEFQNHERQSGMGDTIYSENANVFNNTMLRILDGQECRLDAKYGEVLNKTRNIPIVLIANTIPNKMRSHGPMQERVMRLRFQSRINNIDEERLILTLKGCIQRRIKQQGSLKDAERSTEDIKYNQESAGAFESSKRDVEGGNQKERNTRLSAITENGTQIQILCEKKNRKEQQDTKKEKIMILIQQQQLEESPMATLKYATIPIRKEKIEGKQEKIISSFKSELPGENFKIIRKEEERIGDYLTWPIKLYLHKEKKVCSAEILVVNNQEDMQGKDEEGQGKDEEGQGKDEEGEQKEKDEQNITIKIGDAAKGKKGYETAYYEEEREQWKQKYWEQQEWDEDD